MPKTILFLTNDSWFFVSHRLPIAERLQKLGYRVVVAAKYDKTVSQIENSGCVFMEWKIDPRGKSVVAELRALASLVKIIWLVKPNLIHLTTIKAVLYGGVVARLMMVPSIVYAISGLGAILESELKNRFFFLQLYKYSLSHPQSTMIFQNPANRKKLISVTKLSADNTTIIRGSGVDLEKFRAVAEPEGTPVVVLAARLLKDKGISEFLEAAKILNARGADIEFKLAGDDLGSGNPASYTADELLAIKHSPHINYIGHVEDTATLFANSHIVVLASYHEGLPKVLQEAAACGRAVIASDVPGCVFAVEPGKTALVVPPRDSVALANAIEELVTDAPKRRRFGAAGRKLAEAHFSIDAIVQAHLDIYCKLGFM